MNSFYAMRRANGKWFTVKDNECERLPIFRSTGEAMKARERTRGMMFFRPVEFDEIALKNLMAIKEITVCFWLVSNPKTDVQHGQPLTSEQLADFIKKEKNTREG